VDRATEGGRREATVLEVVREEERTKDEWSPSTRETVVDDLVTLAMLDLARFEEGGPPLRLRTAAPAPHGTAPWIVQPSFDVLVPWDAPPLRVALLGLFADVESVDRVCRFRLTLASVGRGAASFDEPARVLEILAEGANGALPPNVRTTVAGWLERAKRLRGHAGEVLFAADEEQRAFLRREFPGAVEVVPGAFCVEKGSLRKAFSAARREGWTTAPVLGPKAETGDAALRESIDTAAAAVRRFRESLAKGPSAASRGSPVRRDLAGPCDEDDDDLGDDEDGEEEEDAEEEERRDPAGAARPTAATAVFEPVLPGRLRAVLEGAIEAARPIDVLYVNAKNESTERRVRPVGIQETRHGAFLRVLDVTSGSENSLALERITAVRS
jgi:hypothetical protein